MKVQVEYVAQMKSAVGVDAETVELPAPATLETLITVLVERHGEGLRAMLLDEDGAVRSSALIFVGAEQAECGAPHELTEGTKVTLLAPLAGG